VAFLKVADLDQALFQQPLEDVVDLPQADAGVLGQLALGGDFPGVEGVQDLEIIGRKGHGFLILNLEFRN
jgi:hypothetical protein